MLIHRLSPSPGWSGLMREMNEWQREMERLLSFGAPGQRGFPGAGIFPAVQIGETRDAIVVRAEVPGVKREDLEITFEGNALILAGERKVENGEKASWHRREREGGRFRRTIEVSTRIDPNHVSARYANGVLTIELPKAAEAKPRQIAVRAS